MALPAWWSRRRMRHAPAEAVRAYAEGFAPAPSRTPWREARFVVFDTEATGLDIGADRLLSIAGVGMRGDVVVLRDSFECLVAGDRVGADAAPVHGLVPQDLDGGADEESAALDFLGYVGGAILVAHHAAFDVAMLDRCLAAGGGRLLNPVLDTEHLARRLKAGGSPGRLAREPRVSLDVLAARYALETPARHTAAGDALLTALALQRLLHAAEARGLATVGDLLRR